MDLTPYHAKYYAYDLTRRAASGVDRLSMSLFDASVDLNPHQVVIDEAHKLRNAYRTSNKVGQGIRWATEDCRKLLLTATPLQNSLLELYGLSTLIDEHLFGDVDSFRSQYAGAGASLDLLRYMLDVETRGSQSLLNIAAFTDPTAYRLKVKRPGSDESREVNVDLLETFNWLIGLTVQHIAAPQTFSAAFERDIEQRLRLKGRLKQDAAGPYWFRTVTGTTPDGRKTLVIWRTHPGGLPADTSAQAGETPEGIEQDNLVLDEWFTKQGYSSKDSEFDLIYVNGDNNLENLKQPDDTWKVRIIEEDFHRLMFEMEGA